MPSGTRADFGEIEAQRGIDGVFAGDVGGFPQVPGAGGHSPSMVRPPVRGLTAVKPAAEPEGHGKADPVGGAQGGSLRISTSTQPRLLS
ncbi:hypothetical protein GCM10028813_29640 [Ramlibacter alkalitolerans]